jgi:thiamine transport system permease protein
MPRSPRQFPLTALAGLLSALGLLGFGAALLHTLLVAGGSDTGTLFDARVGQLLRFTLLQSTLSTLLSLLVGLSIAWSLAHLPRFRGRTLIVTLLASSLVLPSLIVAFGILSVLGNHGWINQLARILTGAPLGHGIYGLWGIVTAHVYLNASFASVGLLRALETIPTEKYRLAESLGLSQRQRFLRIEWVAIRGTVLSMGTTIFLLCFSSFAIVLLLGGNPAYNTLEVAIYEAVRIDFDIPYALKLAWIQLGIATGLVLLSALQTTPTARIASSPYKVRRFDHPLWHRIRYGIVFAATLAYLLPLVAIVLDGLEADMAALLHRRLFWRSAGMSLGIASVSSILTLLLGLLLADAARTLNVRSGHNTSLPVRLGRIVIAIAGHLYLSIPSLILGLGFFLMARRAGGDMTLWGVGAVVTANVLMSLPFALAILIPAMEKTERRYGRLVRTLDLTLLQRWRYAEWPYLRRSIRYVWALAFLFSLGDLGVIALFGNREITTLPWYLYQLMGSYRTADAAGIALILLVLVIGIFFAVHYERNKDIADATNR